MCREGRDKPAVSLPPGNLRRGPGTCPRPRSKVLRAQDSDPLPGAGGGAAPHPGPRECWWLAQRECQLFLLGDGPAQGKFPPRLSLPEWLSHATVFL